jgi:hypothetical protein
VVKTRMMCSAASRPTMAAAARGVLAQSGPSGFFAGVGTRALSNGINSAVFFCFFEAIRTRFQEQQAAAAAAAASGAVPRPLLPVAATAPPAHEHELQPCLDLASAARPLKLDSSQLMVTVATLKRVDEAAHLVSEDM